MNVRCIPAAVQARSRSPNLHELDTAHLIAVPLRIRGSRSRACRSSLGFCALDKVKFRGWAVVELDHVPDKSRTPKESATIIKTCLKQKISVTV